MRPHKKEKFAEQFLKLTLALPLQVFLRQEGRFIGDLQERITNKYVQCKIAQINTVSLQSLVISLYCYYETSNVHSAVTMATAIPTIKLKRLLWADSMRSFVHKYNVTSFYPKAQNEADTALVSTVLPIQQQNWFPTVIAIGASIIILLIIVLICMCCKKSEKIIEGEELQQLNANNIFEKTPDLSPIVSQGKNTFSLSPKKTSTSSYTFSPNKQTPTIFSFSSPKKYNNEIIYPMPQSVYEMSPPSRVQPQLDLLYPPMRDSPNLSVLSCSGDERQRTLLQSRRGSAASLVIDISPRSPVHDYALHDSPTEELLKHKSRRLQYKELGWNKDDTKTLYEEFWSIPPNTVSRKNSQLKFSLKNRYPDIIPNSRSMVRFDAADENPVYINANFITGFNKTVDEYIATQGPLPCTVNDFWLMIWTFNCSIIAMITKLREKHKEKCVQYWPTSDKVTQEKYGDIIVTYDTQIKRDGYCITTLYISHKGFDESRKITHFWFTAWPDHKVPNDTRQILSLMREVQEAKLSSDNSPVVVHCSAGRGRTGCLIALCMGLAQIENENALDILRIVSHIRIFRGGLVDKVQQYIFLHKALHDYWTQKIRSPNASPSLLQTNGYHNNSYHDLHDIHDIDEGTTSDSCGGSFL